MKHTLLTLLLLSPLAFADDNPPQPEICGNETFNSTETDFQRIIIRNCKGRNNQMFKDWWLPQITNSRFEQNTNEANWLYLGKDSVLLGWLPLTDGEGTGINMEGAWEFNYATVNLARITVYAGQSECTFDISKKGKLFWFKQTERNYNNICPSTLMKRTQLIPLSEYKEEFKLPTPSNNE